MTAGLSAVNLANKYCYKCDGLKPASGFYGRVCADCRREASRLRMQAERQKDPEKLREVTRRWRRNNPERVREIVERKQLGLMGLTPETFAELLASQGGRCAVCGRSEPGGKGRWHVDHDHNCCGRKRACDKCRRGLLCFNCNIALGYLGDSPAMLLAAAEYLTKAKDRG